MSILSIEYIDKTIEEVETTKFLGLQVDNNLNWKKHKLNTSSQN
jgi:hypothetical protein